MTEAALEFDIPSRVRCAVEAALGRQAGELVVLHLEEVCDFTDYFVVCSGSNSRQVEAIGDAVADRLKSHRVSALHVEGVADFDCPGIRIRVQVVAVGRVADPACGSVAVVACRG